MFDRNDIQALRRSLVQLDQRHLEDNSGQTAWIERHLDELDQRLQRIENSLIFRVLRLTGGFAQRSKRRLGRWLLRSPFHALYRRLDRLPDHVERYRQWLVNQQASEPSLQQCHSTMDHWLYQPVISILIPTREPNREWLDTAIASVRQQVYPHWQLSIHNDASCESWVEPYLAEQARLDSRIRYRSSAAPLGISGALNMASELASGDYIAVVDHDDFLSSLALYHLVAALQDTHPPDLLYTDEDTVDEAGNPLRPNFKPDWSPELLCSCMYMGHFLVVRRDRFEQGRFRSEYDGAQDYDLALRMTESDARVIHIPRVLYHWREHSGSTARTPDAKPYTQQAGRRALESAIERRRWEASVLDGVLPNQFIVRRQIRSSPLVSIVVCTRSGSLLRNCLERITKTTDYGRLEIVVVHHGPPDGDSAEDRSIRAAIQQFAGQRVAYSGIFNFAVMNNLGAGAAMGDILLFLNDDTAPLSADWLSILVAQLERPEIGVAGGRLVYPDGLLQHAGIVLGIGEGTGHPGRHLYASDFWKWLDYTRNVSAVTGACLGVRRAVFMELGGFDASFPVNYNDVDFCLRARAAGYEVICDQVVLLRHDECRTRRGGTQPQERRLFFRRWGSLLSRTDPYYSPHLDASNELASL